MFYRGYLIISKLLNASFDFLLNVIFFCMFLITIVNDGVYFEFSNGALML